MKKTGVLAKFGLAASVVFGLAVAAPSTAAAAAPGFSVTPATGLHDGDTVTVSVRGAAPNEVYGIAQCANVGTTMACNGETATAFTTDANGAATFPLTVRAGFQGVTYEGTPVARVDCTQVPCYIGAGNNDLVLGDVVISFS